MFIFRFTGFSKGHCGLGNQLFQIASTVGHARRWGHTVQLEEWEYSPYFKLENIELVPLEDITCDHYHAEAEPDWFRPWYERKGEEFKHPNTVKIQIDGLFIVPEYFHHCEAEIRDNILAFEPTFKAEIKASMPDTKNLCAIHLRRNDYLLLTEFYPILPVQYYLHAMALILETTACEHFLIFSDDIPRVKDLFKETPLADKITYSEGRNTIEDLCAMSLCDYHIIGNSTFSWWGSYLAKSKKTIAPPIWYKAVYLTQTELLDAFFKLRPEVTVLTEHQGEIEFYAFINSIRCQSGRADEVS